MHRMDIKESIAFGIDLPSLRLPFATKHKPTESNNDAPFFNTIH